MHTEPVISNKINYIRYTSPRSGNSRLITIIDGQPFYLSTGNSSNMEGLWLPFIMISPNTPIEPAAIKFLPKQLKSYCLRELILTPITGVFLKIERSTVKVKYFDMESEAVDAVLNRYFNKNDDADIAQGMAGRIPRKSDLINSLRLLTSKSDQQLIPDLIKAAELNKEQQKLINNPFSLADNPQLTTENPAEVNQWLIANGAKDVANIFSPNPPREQVVEMPADNNEVLYEYKFLLTNLVTSCGESIPKNTVKYSRLIELQSQIEWCKTMHDFFEIINEIKDVLKAHRDKSFIGFFKATWIRNPRSLNKFNESIEVFNEIKDPLKITL